MTRLINPANAADRLPLLSSGSSWIGLYDFTSPRGLTLVSGSDSNPGDAACSGVINRVNGALNILGSEIAGNTPDLSALLFRSSQPVYGAKQRRRGTGSRGGIYFDMNEMGLVSGHTTVTISGGTFAAGDKITVTAPASGTLPSMVGSSMSTSAGAYTLVTAPDGNWMLQSGTAFFDITNPGTVTSFTVTDVGNSSTGTATLNWYGVPTMAGALYSLVDVITLDRFRGMYTSQNNLTWYPVSTLGNISLYLGGVTVASAVTGAAPGCLLLNTKANPYNGGYKPLESATVGLPNATSPDGQTLIVVRVMSATDVTTYVNGVLSSVSQGQYTAVTAPTQRIAIGRGATWDNFGRPPSHTHHFHGIIKGSVTADDVAHITSHFDEVMMGPIGKQAGRSIVVMPVCTGQSNADNRNGGGNQSTYKGTLTSPSGVTYTNYSGQTDGNRSPVFGEDMWMGLTGTPNCMDFSRSTTYGGSSWGKPGAMLLLSEGARTDASTYKTTENAFIDDITTTQGDPATYTLCTQSGTAGNYLRTDISNLTTVQGVSVPPGITWVQGENSVSQWTNTSTNATVTGCTYAAAQGTYDYAARYAIGLALFPQLVSAGFGMSETLPMAIQPIASTSGGLQDSWQAIWAVYQILCDQSDGGIFMSNGCPWHQTGIPQQHYPAWAYEYLSVETARTWTWYLKQKGTLYTEGSNGPSYGQFPRIASMTAKAGDTHVDVTVSNPNGASTLKLGTYPQMGWRLMSATTTQAIKTSSAVSNGLTGAAGTMEIGGTQLALAGNPQLVAPFTVRLPLAAALTSGTRLTLFYADPNTMKPYASNTYPLAQDPFLAMATDDSSTACAPEPLLDPQYRRDMPIMAECCGLVVTVA